ncbi:GNAT family N-acetyltransferase [Haloechinothrix sp. LS1_15]|uniref:GNAT family N-acetyltransferase n=1 Tax=Haloechinothrix sp. LS1_15 TaxID=2652248 RepID=UPI00294ADF95|nr:GNAT family N-acetyltransferase [Haloechinothrix sp. LS1_15]
MDYRLHDDPAEFAERAGALFEADPVRHCIALPVLHTMLRGHGAAGEAPLLVSIAEGDRVIGAALQTPPAPLAVSAVPEACAGTLARALREHGAAPEAVSGPREAVAAFVAAWRESGAGEATEAMSLRLHRLTTLREPSVPGELTFADDGDVDVLARYRAALAVEALPPSSVTDHREAARRSIAAGHAHGIWRVDGAPRSCAMATMPVCAMSRIGGVYTPPEYRGHGYGSAVTAGMARWSLDQGAEHVLLFTDLANPVSNEIYRRIGFVPVHEAAEYRLTATTEGS